MLKINLNFGWESNIGLLSVCLKIPIAILIVVFEIPIVNDSDSIGHPCIQLGYYSQSTNDEYIIRVLM